MSPGRAVLWSSTLKRTSFGLTGDSSGDREEASQLSFSKTFTWRARKHLLKLLLINEGLGLMNKGLLTAQLLAFSHTLL